MLAELGDLKTFFKDRSKVKIDNLVFKLHYKFTYVALIACSIIATSTQYIGKPIDCIVDEVPSDFMNAYCWISSTFTTPDRISGRLGIDFIQPGVAFSSDKHQLKYHRYYQWVCFLLFFQALLFYVPHHFWKSFEAGKMKKLRDEPNKTVAKYLSQYFGSSYHKNYAKSYFYCEFLNLINVIGQFFITDIFLGGQFLTYGWKIMSNDESGVDEMSSIFPKVSKCNFKKYGPTGTIQNFDGLCVLAVNIINEKIYLFLWFWFILLSMISLINIAYRIQWCQSKSTRRMAIKSYCKRSESFSKIKDIMAITNYGDDFVLELIGRNLNEIDFENFLADVHKSVNSSDSKSA